MSARGCSARGVVLVLAATALSLLAACSADPGSTPDRVASAEPSRTAGGMTPEQARADTDPNYSNGCYATRGTTEVWQDSGCITGDPEGRTVVLYGDSHSEQWYPALATIARGKGWRLVPLAKMACPPGGESVLNAHLGRAYDECAAWHDSALERIRQEQPDLVIVATRAGYYRVMEGDEALSVRKSAPRLGAALAKDLSAIAGSGAEVILIKDTPDPGFNVPDCVDEQGAAGCSYLLADALPDDGYQLEAAKAAGARVVDLNRWVCGGQDPCEVVQDGVIVFRDDDHMGATFAESLADRLADAL